MGCKEAIKTLLKILREDHILHPQDAKYIERALEREGS